MSILNFFRKGLCEYNLISDNSEFAGQNNFGDLFMKKDKKQSKIKTDISCDPIHGEPHDAFDIINKYGTYNIQPTSDTHNEYPKIAQGLSKRAEKEAEKTDFGEK